MVVPGGDGDAADEHIIGLAAGEEGRLAGEDLFQGIAGLGGEVHIGASGGVQQSGQLLQALLGGVLLSLQAVGPQAHQHRPVIFFLRKFFGHKASFLLFPAPFFGLAG